jgi:hypothetical protein
MSPALNSALALVALAMAVVALVLATVANRRWASRPRRAREVHSDVEPAELPDPATLAMSAASPDPVRPPGPVLDRSALDALDSALAALREQVEEVSARVDDLDARSQAGAGELEALRGEVQDLAAHVEVHASDPTALRHVALVRYDAFADVGGRLSYSLALLDDTRSGVVMTTLAGKADVRTYVRPISAGSAEGSLTAEEQQAIDAAVGSDQ